MIHSDTRDGYSLVETLLAIAIASIISTVLFAITFTYYAEALKSQITSLLAIESQQVLRSLVEDTRLADSIHNTNAIADANGPGGGWTTNDPSDILIIEAPAIDVNRDIIYDASTSLPYGNEYIYFRSGNKRYRRVLKNTSATGNTAVTTCPSSIATSACPADKQLSSYITNLSFTFYDASNVSTADATQARSVLLTANLARKIFGQTITFTNSVQVTLRNN